MKFSTFCVQTRSLGDSGRRLSQSRLSDRAWLGASYRQRQELHRLCDAGSFASQPNARLPALRHGCRDRRSECREGDGESRAPPRLCPRPQHDGVRRSLLVLSRINCCGGLHLSVGVARTPDQGRLRDIRAHGTSPWAEDPRQTRAAAPGLQHRFELRGSAPLGRAFRRARLQLHAGRLARFWRQHAGAAWLWAAAFIIIFLPVSRLRSFRREQRS